MVIAVVFPSANTGNYRFTKRHTTEEMGLLDG